jgi:hypothetical protein
VSVQYTRAGGILPDDSSTEGSGVRAPWEGNSTYDLRARQNRIGLLPFKYASLVNRMDTTLERMLHPGLPIALVIRQSDPEWNGHEGGVHITAFLDTLLRFVLSDDNELCILLGTMTLQRDFCSTHKAHLVTSLLLPTLCEHEVGDSCCCMDALLLQNPRRSRTSKSLPKDLGELTC